MARIGYIRVSTEEQNTARQETQMNDLDKLYIENVSGKSTQRPELKKMMEYIREGDTVVVESISRFAHNTKDLLALVEELTQKGVAIDTATEAMKRLNLKPNTFYRRVKELGL